MEKSERTHHQQCRNKHFSFAECDCSMIQRVINSISFPEWINLGVKNGWTSDIVCYTHDGPQMTDEEVELWDDGQDPCMFMVRVWED